MLPAIIGLRAEIIMSQQNFESLKKSVEADPALVQKLSGVKEVGDVAEFLAGVAAQKGIALNADQIKAQMTASKAGPDDELDDAALEAVSGGGSPYCMFTKGCYCIFTK
ncbi:hypothetical protein P24_05652 [Oceanibaculum indicum P24]|uniref:Nif11 domain-containing protein n=2 Tax=Oceanibaculum indicum TaxID=526216 RepID=K2J2P8_9PROT|nr:hypothetical protein P24_05652 [Oceanibaculum indicum P24]